MTLGGMSVPIACEGLAQTLEDQIAALVRLAEGSRMGSDVLLNGADALTIGGNALAANLCSWEAQLFLEAAARLRDMAPNFRGSAARVPRGGLSA
jgi:uncharacterized protein (DUF39 family)